MASSQTIPESIGENAYRRIRSDIVFGRAAPGQKLKLDRMKDDDREKFLAARALTRPISFDDLPTVSRARAQEDLAQQIQERSKRLRIGGAVGVDAHVLNERQAGSTDRGVVGRPRTFDCPRRPRLQRLLPRRPASAW